MLGIGIETSCDETAIAIVRNGHSILCNVISSQTKEHTPFHGVVPEIASRAHVEKINYLYEMALQEAKISKEDLDYISVSAFPGLIGCLMIGANFAKCLHLITRKPLYALNHIEGHFYAPNLENPKLNLQYPCLGLILSGGNSSIYRLLQPGQIEILVDTMDDACGEAFDKVARILGFKFLNGAKQIEQHAKKYRHLCCGNEIKDKISAQKGGEIAKEVNIFPRLLQRRKANLGFSFSGIKTAVMQAHKSGIHSIGKICHDFQDRCFELVISQLTKIINQTGIKKIIAGGGVLANYNLRERLTTMANEKKLEILYPRDPKLCTDNAAMIASLGYHVHCTPNAKAKWAPLTFLVSSSISSPTLFPPPDNMKGAKNRN